ncbi:MAG: NAD(P)/FAD-dependent oxidoreductase [Gemmatimonadetes bacterium]|uniref:NADH:ubiquinone reductase (non-electrogenic) n=1 Tax=Candidatus Kutchimonas denitrificans TaxID=3056748 RepID=A0AAE4Z4E4_9BACT|nr:NAD(P)/FAD-dependent oxidoreductase [Gemmatimonadota bacterium]NIR73550.1 NAD(P)/FAD-dependent oxidoreductase [Candidatus Kutchimonas denitrificans]NIR99509.1 NAD(P)/FAD-dependent oxidoreductase [Gemmatimonadota bacterium]NIT65129.1 NAD(P)/FAD-dependent oxidoreductase [Gemmatimonadota bacterium]NIV23662.1 FAD-dependent oxidoreductase [Gemmatimonadota bacterium]
MVRPQDDRPVIAVIGAGFGGLNFCKTFRGDARIVLIDKHNHHAFQPLLYQVAMAGLAGSDVAAPVRGIFSRYRHVSSHMAQVDSIDLKNKTLRAGKSELRWDYLVMAMGGVTSYFGNDDWERHAPGLKTLGDALRLRRQLLTAFELAENEPDEMERRRLMTIVVVGGGPTGVELAGAMAELTNHVFRRDFRNIDPTRASVILVEALDRILPTFPSSLSESAREQLEELGVKVRLGTRVVNVQADRITVSSQSGEEDILTRNVLWAAGISAHPLTRQLGPDVELDKAGRVKVLPDLSVPGHPEVFVIGDAAYLEVDGTAVPGLAPAAIQMGKHAAKVIGREIAGDPSPPEERPAFRYRDRGTMATIGRRRAVAVSGPLRFSGYPAWLAWLFVHLIFLVGFRNKLTVMIQWAWQYLTYGRGARVVAEPLEDFVGAEGAQGAEGASAESAASA